MTKQLESAIKAYKWLKITNNIRRNLSTVANQPMPEKKEAVINAALATAIVNRTNAENAFAKLAEKLDREEAMQLRKVTV